MLIQESYGSINSIKDSIITLLSANWPLKVKQIHILLRKDFNFNVSYQAIHKSILELKNNNILIEAENGWQLSSDWINSSYNFFHKVKDAYKHNPFFSSLTGEGNIASLNFKTLSELDDFYFSLLENLKLNTKIKKAIFYLKHNWRPLLYPQKEYNMLQNKSVQHYILCSGNTPLDEWCAKFEQDAGAHTKNGVSSLIVGDLYVLDDLVIQIYISKEITDKIQTFFHSTEKFTDLNINWIIKDVFEKNCKIIVMINKNEEIAKQIKNQTFEMFKIKEPERV